MSMQSDLANPELGYSDEGVNLSDANSYRSAMLPFGAASALPPFAYRSKVFSELESEKIWTRSWVVIGLLQQIPKPGDLLPYTLGFHGIHVQRNADGTISARMNRHQHGGCRFVPVQCRTGEQTKCSITSCNYTRDADVMPGGESGENTDLMYKFAGLTPERLSPVKCETWGPFIFVNLDPECEPLAKQIGDVTPGLEVLLDVPLALRSKLWLDFKCNWKLMGAAVSESTVALSSLAGSAAAETVAQHASGDFVADWLADGGATPVLSHPRTSHSTLSWLFPNVLLVVCSTHVVVVLLQATGMRRVLCRMFVLTAAETDFTPDIEAEVARLSYAWIAFFRERGARAESLHEAATLQGTDARPGTSASDVPLEHNFASYLLNRFVISRVCMEHHYYWTAPIMDAAALLRGLR